MKPRAKDNSSGARVNKQITAKIVTVINENRENLGEMDIKEALDLAYDMGLDLVEVSPNANPPVCKITDYGKFNYDNQKNMRKAKKKQKVIVVKELQMSLNIAEHDYNVKINALKKFITHGDKVKISIRLRGRELIYKDKAIAFLRQCFIDAGGEEFVKYELEPKFEGNTANMILITAK
ncbi:translation initiation factor IF-3 [Rickettsiales bacterium LUAb2]